MQQYNAYQNMLQQNQPQLQQFSSSTNIIWVQGIEGVKAYPVAAGNLIALWDSEANTIYIKMVDAAGIPQPIRVFDYSEREVEQKQLQNYITMEQLNTILEEKFEDFAKKQYISKKQNYNHKGGRTNGKSTV